jgi:hypothetical protein
MIRFMRARSRLSRVELGRTSLGLAVRHSLAGRAARSWRVAAERRLMIGASMMLGESCRVCTLACFGRATHDRRHRGGIADRVIGRGERRQERVSAHPGAGRAGGVRRRRSN